MSSFVNTTKIFCKLSGTLCQFNCLETLIFFKKLSTIRILFCSNDKCALSIILKTDICDICIIKGHKKYYVSITYLLIRNTMIIKVSENQHILPKYTKLLKQLLWLMASSNILIRIEINRWYIVLLQMKMQSLFALRFMHHKSFPISFLSILTWLYWRKTFNKVF